MEEGRRKITSRFILNFVQMFQQMEISLGEEKQKLENDLKKATEELQSMQLKSGSPPSYATKMRSLELRLEEKETQIGSLKKELKLKEEKLSSKNQQNEWIQTETEPKNRMLEEKRGSYNLDEQKGLSLEAITSEKLKEVEEIKKQMMNRIHEQDNRETKLRERILRATTIEKQLKQKNDQLRSREEDIEKREKHFAQLSEELLDGNVTSKIEKLGQNREQHYDPDRSRNISIASLQNGGEFMQGVRTAIVDILRIATGACLGTLFFLCLSGAISLVDDDVVWGHETRRYT